MTQGANQDADEHVLVIGAGIAGLCTALALAPTGRQVTLVERDEPPPSGDPDDAFKDWNRRGVGHLRQSHAFLARLRSLIKAEHPGLLKDLLEAGCREIGFVDMLTDTLRKGYQAQAGDADMAVLTSRRTTLELIMRRYVEHLGHLRIVSGFWVQKLLTERRPDGALQVTGLSGEDASGPRELRADIVIDAGGRTSQVAEQLVAEGATISEASETAGILYFTRHYRLLPGQAEPPRGKLPGTGDLGFLKFGVFPADNGCFSITLCVPEIEMEMRKAVVRPETFDQIMNLLPGMAPWVDPARSEPVSRVFGMGDLHSRWRDFAPEGKPAALGLFAIGDSLVRTNPLYGRGCSFAAVSAYLLRDVLDKARDPAARAVAYGAAIEAGIKPYYQNMLTQDRAAIRRARHALTPSYKPKLAARVLKSFFEDGVAIATRSDVALLREALRGFHMLEHPDAWLKRPGNLAKILGYWAKGKKRNAAAYPPKVGPERDELMTALGLSPQLDIDRLAAGATA
ncbi:MAG: FAD-dependent oxidoreductase [Proteobacteria bacterium]|nr:FAD-dependent oxidoreductase [Pseudomonadota bacterium]